MTSAAGILSSDFETQSAIGLSPEEDIPLILPGQFDALEKSYSQDLPNGDNVEIYAGYPGEPVLGPETDSPLVSDLDGLQAPDGQDWLDTTYTAFGVVTAGLEHDDWKLEVSRFASRNDYRSAYEITRLDSTALRLTWNLDPNWSLQGSWGSLKDALDPQIGETRWTASAKYTLGLGQLGSCSTMLAWGVKQESGAGLNALALDTQCNPVNRWTVFARSDWQQNNALLPTGGVAAGQVAETGSLSLGAVHDWTLLDHVKLGAGGLYAFDVTTPPPNVSIGTRTHGAVAFLRVVAQ
jgi:hypothetical protein